MNFRILLVATLIVAANAAHKKNSSLVQAPIPVQVYYESLSPDSMKFITEQLYPAWKKLGVALDIELVPYGNTNYSRTSAENSTTLKFNCTRGHNECLGNKVQACALHHLTDADDKMKFAKCVMDEVRPDVKPFVYPTDQCAEKLNAAYDKIKACSNSTEGDELLAKLGDATHVFEATLAPLLTTVSNKSRKQKSVEDSIEASSNRTKRDIPILVNPNNTFTMSGETSEPTIISNKKSVDDLIEASSNRTKPDVAKLVIKIQTFKSKLPSVPTIVINKTYSMEESSFAIRDLESVLSLYLGGNSTAPNSAASNRATVLLLLSFVLAVVTGKLF